MGITIFKIFIRGGGGGAVYRRIYFWKSRFMAPVTHRRKTKFNDLLFEDIPPQRKI